MSKKKKKPVKLKALTVEELFGPNTVKEVLAKCAATINKSLENKLPVPTSGLMVGKNSAGEPFVFQHIETAPDPMFPSHLKDALLIAEYFRIPNLSFNLEDVPKTADEYPAPPLGFIDQEGA